MKKYVAGAVLIGTFGLTGCATDPAYIAYRQKLAATSDPTPLTGSRVNIDSTERILRAVGNKEYNEQRLVNSLGNEIALKDKRPGG
jgi:hypothetical protein